MRFDDGKSGNTRRITLRPLKLRHLSRGRASQDVFLWPRQDPLFEPKSLLEERSFSLYAKEFRA